MSQIESKTLAGLTNKEILEAFPNELPLINMELRNLNSWIKVIENHESKIRLDFTISKIEMLFTINAFYCLLANFLRITPNMMRKTRDKLENLKQMYLMMNIKQENTNKPLSIEKAKEVKISTLYNFKKPKMSSGKFNACCPFHSDDTPSFFVYPNNKFHCFSCQTSGSSIDFIMKIHNLNFVQACKYLLEK